MAHTIHEMMQVLGLEIDQDYLRAGLSAAVQAVMEVAISQRVEAGHYERRGSRNNYRNGYRERLWQTRLGDLVVRIPKLRHGSYFPVFLTMPESAEALLLALVEQVYVQGATMKAVEETLVSLGIPPAPRSLAADICEQLDDLAEAYKSRPLKDRYSSLWLDVLTLPDGGRVALAVGVTPAGERVLLACETRINWEALLRRLRGRGLRDVRQVLSDGFSGVREAVDEVFIDARWQYCPAVALGDVLRHVPVPDQPGVVRAISNLLVDSSASELPGQMAELARRLSSEFPRAAAALAALGDVLLASAGAEQGAAAAAFAEAFPLGMLPAGVFAVAELLA